jgi:virginiamycin A acetyltransferase
VKQQIKNLIRAFSFVLALPALLTYGVLNLIVSDKDSIISSFSQFFSLIPGRLGCYMRSVFYHFTLSNCSLEVLISFSALFFQQDTEIDSGVYIGPQCNIGRSRIGKDTLLGSGVHILSGKNQHFTEDLETPIKDQGGEFQKISIGENCWIGNCAVIMADVGNHCIIGAGSVVINEIPDYAIAVGNPARVVKFRK